MVDKPKNTDHAVCSKNIRTGQDYGQGVGNNIMLMDGVIDQVVSELAFHRETIVMMGPMVLVKYVELWDKVEMNKLRSMNR